LTIHDDDSRPDGTRTHDARVVPPRSIETRTSWIVASLSLVMLGLSFGGPWITAVGLKEIASDTGGARQVPSLAVSLALFGVGVGGLLMGRLANTYGVRLTVIIGSVMITIGLFISSLGQPWQLYVGHGLFMGCLAMPGSTRRCSSM